MICARCGNQYEPEEEYHTLCSDCWDEAGMLGDSESYKMWRAVSLLINTQLQRTDLEELVNSSTFMKFIGECLDEMDIPMRARWIMNQAEKYIK